MITTDCDRDDQSLSIAGKVMANKATRNKKHHDRSTAIRILNSTQIRRAPTRGKKTKQPNKRTTPPIAFYDPPSRGHKDSSRVHPVGMGWREAPCAGPIAHDALVELFVAVIDTSTQHDG